MIWIFICLFIVICCIFALIGFIKTNNDRTKIITASLMLFLLISSLLLVLVANSVKSTIRKRYIEYLNLQIQYLKETDEVNKMILETTAIKSYNMWLSNNQEKLHNKWSFMYWPEYKFDYIEIE